MKKALVADWYYVNGGAEKVIHSLNTIWNDFEHFSLIDFLDEKDRNYIFPGKNKTVKTSFIQHFPTAKSNHRKFLELFPLAIEQLDLSKYDLIVSSSASIAKGVLTNANQTHISYIHSPMRYAWDLYFEYLKTANLSGLKGWYAKRVLHKIRMWDVLNTNRVDHIVVNSNYIAKRIEKIYRRKATVIYPPVNIDNFSLETAKDNYYITASRMVPYKKMELIVEAFSAMRDKKLIVIGDGPEMKSIKTKATANVELLGHVDYLELIKYMQKAKAFVYAAEEDFGIVPVEAQACGTPVIAFGKGGVLETVIENETGLFFYEQTQNAIIKAVNDFEKREFSPIVIRKNAERFSKALFESNFERFVNTKINL
tara:strand:+ start:1953 stop:3056 length:1104 start_codon:yes stop_codon:yes gene_type:complete